MKKNKTCLFFYAMAFMVALVSAANPVPRAEVKKVASGLHWLGNGSAAFRILWRGITIYIDPYILDKNDKADLILITHDHPDHLSLPDLRKIATPQTVVLAPASCRHTLQSLPVKEILAMKPGLLRKFRGVAIMAVPAYNVKKSFHPKEQGGLGYVMDLAGVKIYHVGDSELIPEMKSISCAILLTPLGQDFTMNSVEDVAQLARQVKASIVIPMHWGFYEGSRQDAEKLQRLLRGQADVIIQ